MGIFIFGQKGGDIMKEKTFVQSHSKKQIDNYSNQKNPNSKEYRANLNNRANQLNPNNIRYYLSRIKNV